MKFKNYIETESGIKDTSTSPGTAGQLLSSTVAGTSWIDQNTISSGSSEVVDIQVKNIASADGGVNLSKGDPVYIYGSVGASARLYVDLADADSTATNNLGDSKMPCVALLDQDLSPNGEGTATVVGKLRNLITNPIDGSVPDENDTVYVKPGGGLTLAKPAGSTNLIQNVGQVGRVSTSADGNIVVAALLRTNDVPNLPEGRLFVGTSDNTSLTSDVVYIDEPDGRVGIGTTSPLSAIQIGDGTAASPSTNQIIVLSNTATTGGSSNLYLATGASGTSTIGVGSTQFSPTNTAGKIIYSDIVDTFSFNTNFSTKMVINGSGDVGIGETNPGAKLEVVGSTGVIIDSGSSSAAKLTLIGDGSPFGGGASIDVIGGSNDYLSYILNIKRSPSTLEASNSYFQYNAGWEWNGNQSNSRAQPYTSYSFRSQGSSQMVIYNNNLGIGVTTPSQKLHVNGSARVTGAYYDSSNSPGAANSVLISTISGTVWGARGPLGSGTTNYLARWTPDGNTLGIGVTYDNGTNVGIGTTSLGSKLTVDGTTRLGGDVEVSELLSGDRVLTLTANGGSFAIGDIDGLGDQAFISGDSSSISISTNQITTLHCDSNNRVGIGTDDPNHKLEVSGNALIKNGSNAYLYLYNTANFLYSDSSGNTIIRGANNFRIQTVGSAERVRVNSSGNVGINTTDPKTKLHVASANGSDTPTAGTATGGLFVSNTNKTYGINMGVAGAGWGFIQSQRADGNTTLYSLNLQPLGGNVGIGTTTPDVKFEVESTDSASGIRIKNTSTGYASLDIESNRVTGDNIGGLRYKKTGQAVSQAEINYVTGTRLDFLLGNGTAALTNKLSILENGNVGINDNTPSYKLDVNGTGRFTSTVTATNFILSSDETLKDNIKEIDTKHVDVDWKNFELKSEPGIKRAGVIAQELEIKHPEFVRTADDGLKSVAYIDLLITKIAELEARLEKLEK